MPVRSSKERAGTAIGHRFLLGAPIFSSSWAVTFAAQDALSDRPCWVKLPNPQSDDAVERLLRETEISAKLWHPHLIHVLDTGTTDDGLPFIATETLKGSSLEDHLRHEGPMDIQQALILLLPIMGALAKAHTIGIIHCGIHPGLLFIHEAPSGQLVPKLLDFSRASIEEEASPSTPPCPAAEAAIRAYCAPEHRGGPCIPTPRLDVWSMCAVLYRCVIGAPPDGHPGNPLAQRVGPDLAYTLEQGLSDHPDLRYPTMTHMAKAILEAAWRQGIALPADPDPEGLPSARAWRDTWRRHAPPPLKPPSAGAAHGPLRYLPWITLVILAAIAAGLASKAAAPADDEREYGSTVRGGSLDGSVAGSPPTTAKPAGEASEPAAQPAASTATTVPPRLTPP